MRNKFFYGGNGIGIPTAKSLTTGRTWQRMLALFALIVTLGIGQMWAAEIFSWTVSSAVAKDATVDATGGTVTCTGSAMGSETPSSSGYFKFNSSTQLTFTLSSGTFAAGDVISFNFTSGGNNKTVGVEIQETSPVTQLTETVATKGTSVTKTYTVAASDGIQGQNKFSIKRVDSNFSFKSVSVTRSSGDTPVCPSGLTISSKNDQTAFTEGDKIELTAALEAGNGTITYQWYKGSVAAGNAISGATSAIYEKSNCTTADAGDYFCVASKDDCSDAVNESAFAITVAAAPVIEPTGTATISYALSGSTTTGTVTGVNSISGLSSSLTLSTLTLSGTKDGYSGAIKGCTSTTELVEDDYVDVQFTVGSGYVFTPSAVTVQVNPFTATGAVKAVVKVMDAQPLEVASEVLSCAKSTDNAVTFASGAFTNKKFEGTVHLRMYFYGAASSKTFYLKSPISITGTVAVAPTKYNVTFDKNDEGASGSQATLKYEAGAEVTLPACTFDAPTGKEFDAWISTDVTITDGKFTMPSSAVTIKATWKTSSTKYTVTYKEGETTLDTEDVVAGTAPTGYSALESKNLASFVAWYNNADLAEEHKIADMSAETVSEATTYYGKWTYNYASSVNIEQWTLDNGKGVSDAQKETQTGALVSLLGTRKFASNIAYDKGNIELDSLNDDPGKTNRNYAYLGLKVKKSGKMLDFRLAKDSYVKVKFGNVAATPKVSINGADYADMELTAGVYSYTATGNDYVSIKTASDGAVVFQQVMINEPIAEVTLPWRVTYDANGGTCATAEAIWSGSALILPDVTPAEPADYTFAGWYDEATGGVLVGAAGASYTPTDNTTLFAHFAPVEYAIAYDGNGATSGSMVAGAAGWGTMVTPDANAFEKTGHVFSGWEITKTEDGSATGITFSEGKFEMPKYDVTLVAQWDDISKVAVIVETNVKYESLADAIAAATDGQTIQLLQNNDVTAQVEVAGKAITLDLAGYKIEYTGTSTLPSGVILVHNGASLTIDDSSDPDAGSIVAGEKAYAAIALTKAGDDAANPAILTVNGGTLSGYYYGITGNGSRHNTVTTINGGTITGTCAGDNLGIYHPQNGTLTINGGTITAYSAAVEMRAGTLVITGGTLTATATEYSCNPNGSGTTTVGAAIAISQHTTKKDIAVTISGGTFEGVKAINESNPQVNDPAPQVSMAVTDGDFTGEVTTVDVNNFISGGTFDAPVANENCATGWVPSSEVSPGIYTVVPKDGVCLVKIEPTSQSKGTLSGLYADGDELTINLSSGMNLGGSGKYIGVKATENFQEGDVLHLNMSTYQNNQNATAYVYADKDASVFLFDTEEKFDVDKDYYITMPAAVNGHNELYIVRTDGNKWNGGPSIMEVTRAMKPMLTAITIDGRDGVIDEEHKTVEVTIPNEAVLSALTVVPTIVWNEAAATNSIVVNDGSAWIEGANTYKLTDKDGDYTDYTITLTRDVLKHTVSFNVHGGSAVDAQLVVDGENPVAPAEPTKEDYLFQYWSETEDGAEVDVTTVQINADKEFHAVWASDGAIKLLDGSTVNHTNFITGVTADETVEFQGNTVNYAKFSGTVSGVNGVKDLTRVIAYNATTNKTKIQISAHNNSTSARNILVKGLVEGASAAVDLATIALGNKEDKVSDWIEFDNAANRTIYIMVSSSAGDVYFTQVKVIESGETPMKQVGEAGYSLNLNKGRFFGTASTDLAFEGLNARLSGDYTALNSGYAKLNATSMSFTVANPVLLKVTTNNNKTYYVTKGAAGTDNETAKAGESEFALTAGTWYITAGAAEVQFTNLAFELPKCEKPVITTEPATKINFGPGNLTATVVAAEPTEGTLSYQWYNADGDTEVDGATEATLTTTTEGTYYVIVTNSLAGYQDNSTKSAEATLSYRVINDATLSALSYGDPATAIALEADKYEYRVILDEGTTDVPALHATATMDTYADVVITDAATFTDYNAQSTVHVTAEDGVTELTYTVNFIVKHIYTALEDVIESTTWNWTGSVDQKINDVPNKGVIIANYIEGDNFEMIEGKADEYARRNQNGGVYQGTYLHFNTTVPGKVKFYFRAPSSGENCTITVKNGGRTVVAGTRSNSFGWSNEVFVEGDVVIEMVNDKAGGGTTRVQQVVFTVAEPDYTRPVRQGYYGTICLPNGGVMANAALYDVAYFDAPSKKIYFDQIIGGVMEAGVPYIFLPNEGEDVLKVYYTDEADAPAGSHNGLVGSYVQVQIEDGVGNYILSNNRYREVVAGALAYVTENRAYIQMSAVPNYAAAPAPGRRRIAFDVQSAQSPTDLMEAELLNAEGVQKMVINGELFILRGGKMFDATGRLVK